jgi:hypothetical protein
VELRVDKLRREARVILQDGEELRGSFFVSPISPCRSGPELVSDLLTGEAYFLPFEMEDGQVVFLQRDFIRYVVLKEKEAMEDLPYLKRKAVEVHLLSGETLGGEVLLDLPQTRCRLSDFFNSCPGFFYFLMGGEQHLVNSRSVRLVRPAP